MSTISDPVSAPPTRAAQPGYRTLWRWHFYAGLFVMPLLLVLAVTGTIYCFQPQIEPLLYPHRLVVAPAATPRLPVEALLARAQAALPPARERCARTSKRIPRAAPNSFSRCPVRRRRAST